jgi:hypothetical protein
MCVQTLLDTSQPSVCSLVPFFNSGSVISNQRVVSSITHQNVVIDILESGVLSNPEELIVVKTILNRV